MKLRASQIIIRGLQDHSTVFKGEKEYSTGDQTQGLAYVGHVPYHLHQFFSNRNCSNNFKIKPNMDQHVH